MKAITWKLTCDMVKGIIKLYVALSYMNKGRKYWLLTRENGSLKQRQQGDRVYKLTKCTKIQVLVSCNPSYYFLLITYFPIIYILLISLSTFHLLNNAYSSSVFALSWILPQHLAPNGLRCASGFSFKKK